MSDIRLKDYTTKIKGMIREVRLDEAIHHCQHILRHYPKHIDTYCLLGEACLEREMYRESIEFFQRTLSADPENLVARVGLGVIYDEQRALPEAIWQLERAFELAPGNAEVRRELQRLYAQHGGVQKTRLRLTRGALGRLYSRNGLYERAIDEFHAVLRQDPDLPDIHVALAEALWRAGKKLEAVEVCLDILESLPNCLKANLILGEIWTRGGNEEAGDEKLSVARDLDPENLVAHEMMGRDAPLPVEEVFIPELEAVPDTFAPFVPAGVGVAALAARELIEEQEEGIPEAAEAWEADEGLPDWLRDMGVAEEEPATAMEGEELGLAEVEPEEGPPAEVPEWLREVTGEGIPPVAEEAALFEDEAEAEEVMAAEQASSVEEVPDWLREIEAVEAGAASPPPEESPLVEGVLDNGDATSMLVTAGIVDDRDLELDTDQVSAGEVPEWLQELFDEEAPSTEQAAPPPALEAVEEEAPPGVVAPPPGAIPASLLALVEAGLLDEADIESAMAEMSADEIEAQRAEDVPEWLQEMVVEEPAAAEQMVEPAVEIEAPEDEIPAFEEAPLMEEALVEEMPSFEEEAPVEVGAEWLWKLAEPPEEEAALAAEAPVEEVPPVEELAPPVFEAPVEEVPPVEELAPSVFEAPVEEVPPIEELAPPVFEAPVEEVPPVEEFAPPIFEAPVEEVPPVEELALPVSEAPVEEVPPMEELAPPVSAVRVEEEPPLEEIPWLEEVAPLEVEEPVREALPAKEAAPPISEAPPIEKAPPRAVEVPEEEMPPVEEEVIAPSRVDELLEQLKAQPRDYGARLDLAREYLAEGDMGGALTHYEKLVSVRKRLPDVLGDLEPLLEKDVDRARVYHLLGDIYMQQDQLDQALEMYRQARRSLTTR